MLQKKVQINRSFYFNIFMCFFVIAMIKNVNKNIRLLLIFKMLLSLAIVKIKRPINLNGM